MEFEIKNELINDEFVLTLSGIVSESYWEDDQVIDEASVREQLDNVTQPIRIRLNSPGGDIFEGISIYNYIKDHPSKITVEITGNAASAASIIAMGADELIMNTGTSIMVHEASTFAYGNKQDVQKTLNALETIDESLIDIYEARTGASRETIQQWIENETWFSAKEAVEHNLADSVKERKKIQAETIVGLKEAFKNMQQEINTLKQARTQEEEVGAISVPKTGLNKIFGGKQ